MEKRFMLIFVLLLSVSFVFAANGWGDINTGGDVENDSDVVSGDDSSDFVPTIYTDGDSSGAETKYTQNFYIALGFAGVGILIAVFFAYLFLKRPKNKWKKPKQKIVKG